MKKMDRIDVKLKKFGFKSVENIASAEDIRKAHEEIWNEVKPIIEEIDRWAKESSGTIICYL